MTSAMAETCCSVNPAARGRSRSVESIRPAPTGSCGDLVRLPQQQPQHIRQDPAVAVVLDFDRRVDPTPHLKRELAAIAALAAHGQQLAWHEPFGYARDGKHLAARQAE